MNLCVTLNLPIIKEKLPCNIRIGCRQFFTVTGNNDTMYSESRIGNSNFHSKLPFIVFQINSISLIGSEEFRETSNDTTVNLKTEF